MSSRFVKCLYNDCREAFTSKHLMKEHVLSHLVAEPPKPIHQHARIRWHSSGGWTVVEMLGDDYHAEGEGSSERMDVDAVEGGGSLADVTGEVDEVDAFRLKDILPSTSQAGNITTTTTTTTTSGGSTSQPTMFSPVLPNRPTQISLSTQQSSQSSHASQLAAASSPAIASKSHGSQSREPPSSPYVHTAPSRSTPSPIRTHHTRIPKASQSPRRASRAMSPLAPDSQVFSSTPLDQRPVSTPSSTQSTSAPSASLPSTGSASGQTPSVTRSLSFGGALGPSHRIGPSPQSAVTFGFGSR